MQRSTLILVIALVPALAWAHSVPRSANAAIVDDSVSYVGLTQENPILRPENNHTGEALRIVHQYTADVRMDITVSVVGAPFTVEPAMATLQPGENAIFHLRPEGASPGSHQVDLDIEAALQAQDATGAVQMTRTLDVEVLA